MSERPYVHTPTRTPVRGGIAKNRFVTGGDLGSVIFTLHDKTGAVMPPIFNSSTFAHGNPQGFDYTRSGNPNFRILESVLAAVESCQFATVFASGVSAITAIASTLQAGDLVLCEENLYGCTVRLFEQVFSRFGVQTAWLDFTNPSALDAIAVQKPAMIWLESPTNPLLKVIDLAAVCDAATSQLVAEVQ